MIRILHIEDDAVLARSIARYLARSFPDCVVDGAANAWEARSCLNSERYDAIICDYELADGTTGDDVVAELTDEQCQRFIWLTSYDMGSGLVKPCRPSELRDAINRVLGKAEVAA